MENPRREKVAVVEEVKGRLETSDGAIITEYRGLKVQELAELRRSLRPNGGDYKIYKNTLVRLAVDSLGMDGLKDLLVGPTAIAFVDGDPAAVAKALRDFGRTHSHLVVKASLLGDRLLDSAETETLATLPSRDVLLARIAGGLAAPMRQLAGLFQALPRNFAYGLMAYRDQRAEGEPDQEEAPAPDATSSEPSADSEVGTEQGPAPSPAQAQTAQEETAQEETGQADSAQEEVTQPEPEQEEPEQTA